MGSINTIIKEYFKNNKIKFKDISDQLNMSQSNLSERLSSNRSITLDEFFTLYDYHGDEFAIKIIQHYKAEPFVLVKVKQLIKIKDALKQLENDQVHKIIDEIDRMINVSINRNNNNNHF